MADTKQIKIKLVKSLIGCSPAQRKVAQSLGLSKTDQVVNTTTVQQLWVW